jgi:hypothetical protein
MVSQVLLHQCIAIINSRDHDQNFHPNHAAMGLLEAPHG